MLNPAAVFHKPLSGLYVVLNIRELCDQVLALSEYKAELYAYLRSRMNTIAPNLTALVGELVGARLIAHGGSLLNLAKQPGSTIQILGAEKVCLLLMNGSGTLF